MIQHPERPGQHIDIKHKIRNDDKKQNLPMITFALKILVGIGIMIFGPLAFFMLIDLIDNPIISAIIGSILLLFIAILAGLGKVTGEIFGANKATLVLKSLFHKNDKNIE